MRSIKINESVFHVNSDFTGEVTISSRGNEIKIEFKDLYYFFTEYSRAKLEEHFENILEDSTAEEIIRLCFTRGKKR